MKSTMVDKRERERESEAKLKGWWQWYNIDVVRRQTAAQNITCNTKQRMSTKVVTHKKEVRIHRGVIKTDSNNVRPKSSSQVLQGSPPMRAMRSK